MCVCVCVGYWQSPAADQKRTRQYVLSCHTYTHATHETRDPITTPPEGKSRHIQITSYVANARSVTHTHTHFAAHIWINYARPFRRKFKMRARIRKLFAPSLCDNFQIVIERSPGGEESGAPLQQKPRKPESSQMGTVIRDTSQRSAVFLKPINSPWTLRAALQLFVIQNIVYISIIIYLYHQQGSRH